MNMQLIVLKQILLHTPTWVWGVLALLIVLGTMQMRTRSVTRVRLLLIPTAMTIYSLVNLELAYHGQVMPLVAWVAGVGVALLVNQWIKAPGNVRHDPLTGVFHVPGSVVPMILMLSIFALKFVIAINKVLSPELAGSLGFIAGTSLFSGMLSGTFTARALQTWQARSRSAAPLVRVQQNLATNA